MKNENVKRMVGIALLMAMVVVLQIVGGWIPSVGGFSFSLVLIPIVVGAAIYGAKAGALLGCTFGVVVTINCITGVDPSGAMVFQANPALCILVVLGKGILAGLAAGGVYSLLREKNAFLAMLLAAVVCPVVNTGTFILCMVLFFNKLLAAWAGGTDILGFVLNTLVLFNFVPELIINVAFSPAGQRILKIVNRV